MKKGLILILVLLLMLSSCQSKPRYWEFEQDFSKVSQISIVEITFNDDGFEEIKEIDENDYARVFDEISKMEMSRYKGGLKTPSGLAIKVSFENGEYDLITKTEPQHFRYDEKTGRILGYNSYLCCNEEQFENLIDSCLE